MKHKHSACIPSFIHLCTHRDKTVKENHLKTGADRRQRKMSLPGKVGEMSHAVEVCVCVYTFLQTELIRCLLNPYLSHLYFHTPFNPSSWISTPCCSPLKPLLSLSLQVSLHRSQYLLSFSKTLSFKSQLQYIAPLLFLSLCSERQKMVSFALSICHSSLVLPYLKLFDSITVSI